MLRNHKILKYWHGAVILHSPVPWLIGHKLRVPRECQIRRLSSFWALLRDFRPRFDTESAKVWANDRIQVPAREALRVR
jgi:hypothetical protein